MKIRYRIFALLVTLTALSFNVQAVSLSIPVGNYSFESPGGLADGDWSASVDDWATSGGAGILNPDATMYPGGAAPDGNQVAFANRIGSLTTTSNLGNLAAGSDYTVKVAVGKRLDMDFPATGIQLLAGGNVLAPTTVSTSVPGDGEFVDATLTFRVTDGSYNDAFVGEALAIALLGNGAPGEQVNFDNVRLNVAPVPLPAGVVLFISALTGLGLLGRRRTSVA